jgi:type I restriction enzyme M protein
MKIKDWGRYYTSPEYSKTIVEQIDSGFRPKSVVDICAGSGNMLIAATSKWPDAELIGVDVKLSPDIQTKSNSYLNLSLHEFDALNTRLLSEIEFRSPKVVLANPPFGVLPLVFSKSKVQNSNLLNVDEVANATGRIEAVMLVSNLSILNKGDWFGAVLPENLFSGDKMSEFKSLFFNFFELTSIGKHQFSFQGSEVRTRSFVGRFNGGSHLPIVKNAGKVEPSKSIQLKYRLVRGMDNSKLISNPRGFDRQLVKEVVHFNNPSGKMDNPRYLVEKKPTDRYKIDHGDLLILRVGRNAGEIIVPSSLHLNKLISDHFILVKRGEALLTSRQINMLGYELRNSTKGLATKYVSKKDIWTSIESAVLSN